jgi:hypothetical protein
MLIGCRNNPTNLIIQSKSVEEFSSITSHRKCYTVIVNDTLRQNILKLNYNCFNKNAIEQLFNQPVSVSKKNMLESENAFYYVFKSGKTEIHFSGTSNMQEFFLDYAKFADNSIKLNYGIFIGMNKALFFNNLKLPTTDCDSISIVDDTSNNLYLFVNDTLQEITVTTGI